MTRISLTISASTQHDLFNDFSKKRIARIMWCRFNVNFKQHIGNISIFRRPSETNHGGRNAIPRKGRVKVEFLQRRRSRSRQLDQHNVIGVCNVAIFWVGKFLIDWNERRVSSTNLQSTMQDAFKAKKRCELRRYYTELRNPTIQKGSSTICEKNTA